MNRRRPRPRPISLRRRARAVFGATLATALLGTVLGALTLRGVFEARSLVVDRLDPAIVEVERLLAALVDQESGLRAFVITGEVRFLGPYVGGTEAQADSTSRLRELLRGVDGTGRPVQRVLDAAMAWRRDHAEPTLVAIGAGDATAADLDALDGGRAQFDEVRAAIAGLEADLAGRRRAARADLDRLTTRLVATLVGASALMVTAVVSLWLLVRRSVQVPLDALRADASRVADGEVDHEVSEVGPQELRELAAAMEAMRARIVDELRASDAARRDLLERTEELGRSNAELEQFAYVASHDLQEPLRKVASFCQLLQARYGGQLDERADQYIGFAVDGAKRMQQLINDLLAFSRVGRVTTATGLVALEEVRDQAIDALADVVNDAGATIESDPLPEVRGERALLAALFQNLIGNAVKYRRPDVAPHVRVTVAPIEGGYELAVADNGIGIEPHYAERVFVIFQRLHSKEAYEGTGIGLALCRKIVEHHGGRIWVDTQVTTGTTVRFTLPDPGPAVDDDARRREGDEVAGAPLSVGRRGADKLSGTGPGPGPETKDDDR